eukprot:20846-Heterococcus_DN1.PRE.2
MSDADFYSCPICCERYSQERQPRIMSCCSRAVCTQCCVNQQNHNTDKCPLCRAFFRRQRSVHSTQVIDQQLLRKAIAYTLAHPEEDDEASAAPSAHIVQRATASASLKHTTYKRCTDSRICFCSRLNSAPGELLADWNAKLRAQREQEARDHDEQTQSFLQSEGDNAHSLEQQAALLQRLDEERRDSELAERMFAEHEAEVAAAAVAAAEQSRVQAAADAALAAEQEAKAAAAEAERRAQEESDAVFARTFSANASSSTAKAATTTSKIASSHSSNSNSAKAAAAATAAAAAAAAAAKSDFSVRAMPTQQRLSMGINCSTSSNSSSNNTSSDSSSSSNAPKRALTVAVTDRSRYNPYSKPATAASQAQTQAVRQFTAPAAAAAAAVQQPDDAVVDEYMQADAADERAKQEAADILYAKQVSAEINGADFDYTAAAAAVDTAALVTPAAKKARTSSQQQSTAAATAAAAATPWTASTQRNSSSSSTSGGSSGASTGGFCTAKSYRSVELGNPYQYNTSASSAPASIGTSSACNGNGKTLFPAYSSGSSSRGSSGNSSSVKGNSVSSSNSGSNNSSSAAGAAPYKPVLYSFAEPAKASSGSSSSSRSNNSSTVVKEARFPDIRVLLAAEKRLPGTIKAVQPDAICRLGAVMRLPDSIACVYVHTTSLYNSNICRVLALHCAVCTAVS